MEQTPRTTELVILRQVSMQLIFQKESQEQAENIVVKRKVDGTVFVENVIIKESKNAKEMLEQLHGIQQNRHGA